MRDIKILFGMEELKTLFQYLYLDESHTVEVKNSIGVPLQISMDDEGNLWLKNLNFPDVPKHLEEMSISTLLAVISQLKDAPRKETAGWQTGEHIKTRWDEIEALTSANVALNRNSQR